MGTTPHEIRTVELPRSALGGYRRREVDEVLDEAADSLAAVTRERDELRQRVEILDAEAAAHADLETMLRSTLVAAERATQETREQARRESDLIVREAHAEARRITREANAEKRRLEEDMAEIRVRLNAALDKLAASANVAAASEEKASEQSDAPIDENLEKRLREVTA